MDEATGEVLVSKDKMMDDNDADIIVEPRRQAHQDPFHSALSVPGMASARSATARTWRTVSRLLWVRLLVLSPLSLSVSLVRS